MLRSLSRSDGRPCTLHREGLRVVLEVGHQRLALTRGGRSAKAGAGRPATSASSYPPVALRPASRRHRHPTGAADGHRGAHRHRAVRVATQASAGPVPPRLRSPRAGRAVRRGSSGCRWRRPGGLRRGCAGCRTAWGRRRRPGRGSLRPAADEALVAVHRHAADLGVLERDPHGLLHRRVVAQRLLDGRAASVGSSRSIAHCSGWPSRARVALPMRFTVVSNPARSSSEHIGRSSGRIGSPRSATSARRGRLAVHARARRRAARRGWSSRLASSPRAPGRSRCTAVQRTPERHAVALERIDVPTVDVPSSR